MGFRIQSEIGVLKALLFGGLLAAVVVTLATKAPGEDVEALFDASVAATKGE